MLVCVADCTTYTDQTECCAADECSYCQLNENSTQVCLNETDADFSAQCTTNICEGTYSCLRRFSLKLFIYFQGTSQFRNSFFFIIIKFSPLLHSILKTSPPPPICISGQHIFFYVYMQECFVFKICLPIVLFECDRCHFS